jgi:hypothetical protein
MYPCKVLSYNTRPLKEAFMAFSRQELRELAITGAQAKIKELDAQRMALLREFPELNSSSQPASRRRTKAAKATLEAPRRRRRTRRFTAAQRRAISQRMKRYWAERRKNGRKVA